MTGGKKRGASSATDGSGRRGKKRSVPTSSSGSGGKGREKVDSETKKMDKALKNTYKLSIACKQHTLEEVGRATWKLKTDEEGVIQSSYADFKRLLDDRRKLYKKVMSLLILGVVVTQPSSNETYHIINIEIDDELVLQLLFQNSDGYLVAFSCVKTKANPDIWEGWFCFQDQKREISLPSFCEEKRDLKLDIGYTKFHQIGFGRGAVSNILKCLLAFTPGNYTLSTYGDHDRVVQCESLMVLFGECQRSGVFLEFAEKHYESDTLCYLTNELSKHRGSWSNLSKALLALYFGFLEQKLGVHGWEITLNDGVEAMTREVREFTGLGYNGIEKFIEYHDTLDEKGQKIPKFTSMQNLLGTDVGQLLHLIKYDEKSVLKIHLAMIKAHMDWPVPMADD